MELKQMIKDWNNAQDLNDFMKSVQASNLTKENIEEFKNFLAKSYGKGFNTEKIINHITPLAS